MKKAKNNILKNVDFLDLVRIHVYPGQPHPTDRHPFRIEFESVDKTKRVVFDESSIRKMNEILTEKASQFHPSDPRVRGYLEEFAGRLASELYRNGLVELDDIPDAPDDPYTQAKKSVRLH